MKTTLNTCVCCGKRFGTIKPARFCNSACHAKHARAFIRVKKSAGQVFAELLEIFHART